MSAPQLLVGDALIIVPLLVLAVALLVALARKPRRPIHRIYACPHQDAIDALILARYRAALSRSAKAIRAEAAMRHWHADPRSEGRIARVVWLPIKRERHHLAQANCARNKH